VDARRSWWSRCTNGGSELRVVGLDVEPAKASGESAEFQQTRAFQEVVEVRENCSVEVDVVLDAAPVRPRRFERGLDVRQVELDASNNRAVIRLQ
jgi:hypothetical protein